MSNLDKDAVYNDASENLTVRYTHLPEPIPIGEFKALLLPELVEGISDEAIIKGYDEIRLLSEYSGRPMQDLAAELNKIHGEFCKD